MKTALITIATLFIAGAALAQANIFPPLISGQYNANVRTAPLQLDGNGVPFNPGGESVGVFNVETPDHIIACVDTAPDTITPIAFTVVAAGDRAEIRAKAFETDDCDGGVSGPSLNAAFVYFTGPDPPELAP